MVMVKVKFNQMRLGAIINNFIENLEDLEYSINKFYNVDIEDTMEIRHISKSIRVSSSAIFTNCEDYLGMCLKKVGIGVSDKPFRDCLKYAIEFNLINKEFANSLMNNMEIRNFMDYNYSQPSIEQIINFYKLNRDAFDTQIEFMENLSKKELDKKDLFKKSSIFEN